MLKVKNMVSARSGRTVTNQFDISRTDEAGVIGEYAFQSYDSLCASLKRTEGGLVQTDHLQRRLLFPHDGKISPGMVS